MPIAAIRNRPRAGGPRGMWSRAGRPGATMWCLWSLTLRSRLLVSSEIPDLRARLPMATQARMRLASGVVVLTGSMMGEPFGDANEDRPGTQVESSTSSRTSYVT